MNYDKEWKIVILIVLTLSLQLIGYIFFPAKAHAADNSIYIDSVGNYNQVTITQDGSGHIAGVAIGAYLPSNSNDLKTGYGIGNTPYLGQGTSEFNYVSITQQGLGTKTTTVEIANGSNNNISILQDGSGNHTMNIISNIGTTNSNNTINTTQTGSGDKSFALTMAGSNGANVTVQQTNPTQANTGSMTIQCNPCGSYSYIRQ